MGRWALLGNLADSFFLQRPDRADVRPADRCLVRATYSPAKARLPVLGGSQSVFAQPARGVLRGSLSRRPACGPGILLRACSASFVGCDATRCSWNGYRD